MQSLSDWCKENNRQDLIDEWNSEKNGDKTPFNVASHSSKKVWWIGGCGHEWDSRIDHRTTMNTGCPFCSGKRVLPGFNDLMTVFPEIAKEWNPARNSIKPSEVSAFSKLKVWWRCERGHEWEAVISNRTGKNKAGCPFCSGRKVLVGVSDLASNYPELIKEWHPNKNGDLRPVDVSAGSNQKVWWLGKCGHEWKASISDRTSGKGCAYCSNRKLLKGFNDLQTKYAEISAEWHPTKNGNLNPSDILYGSHKKVWWMCVKGHEWEAEVKSRTGQNTGCPYCSGRIVINGVNDLQTIYPDIAKEWDYEKNGNLSPSNVAFSAHNLVWWKCELGHEWKASLSNRTGKNKSGCPYCSNRKILVGFNDLATANPQLSNEWDYERNKGLLDGHGVDVSSPDKVSPVSGISVWWKCEKGHEWRARISNRVHGDGCPLCSNAGTSIREQGIAFYLEQVCRTEHRSKIAGKEIDVYLPDYKIGIEYDGRFYHKIENAYKEVEKDRRLYVEGIHVIRVKESNINRSSNNTIYFIVNHIDSNYEWAINRLFEMLHSYTGDEIFTTIDVDVKRDQLKIRERVGLYVKNNNISVMYPEIAKEWNYDKNGILSPEMFTFGSDVKVWWKCSKGHEWQTSISHRTARGDGCPYCSKKRSVKGEDFESWCVEKNYNYLLNEWNYDKNHKNPSEYASRSRAVVWWRCDKGHEWKARIGSRPRGGRCPFCDEEL